MIEFKNDKLKQDIIDLVNFYEKCKIECDLCEKYWNENDLRNVDYEYCFGFSLPYDEGDDCITVRDALNIRKDVLSSELDRAMYKNKNKLIIRVASLGLTYENVIELMKVKFTYKKKTYNIWLSEKSEEYTMAVCLNDEYNEYVPPRLMDDLFINIYCEDGLDENIDAIIQRYIFEVNSIFGIQIFISPRPEYIEYEENLKDNRKIIDTEIDDSLTEILSIFNKSSNIGSIESKILNYTRVIEYVSQTVIKKDLFESVFNKLSSDRVYSPNSDYILELQQIFKDNDKYKKDSESIKITVKQCCDVMNLKSHAPKFLKKINKLKTDSKKSEQTEALDELGRAIVDTRNMFSHAKTNYTKKGMECSNEELFKFEDCMKVVANQVIRWYARQSDKYIIK